MRPRIQISTLRSLVFLQEAFSAFSLAFPISWTDRWISSIWTSGVRLLPTLSPVGTWFVWDKARQQIEVELELLTQLMDEHHALIQEVREREPSPIERSALAVLLHSFYNGVENVFKRIALEIDGYLPSSDRWHRDLLDAMTSATTNRPAVLGPELRNELAVYMGFRHFFRHLYTFQFDWAKMAEPVFAVETVHSQVARALVEFLAHGQKPSESEEGTS